MSANNPFMFGGKPLGPNPYDFNEGYKGYDRNKAAQYERDLFSPEEYADLENVPLPPEEVGEFLEVDPNNPQEVINDLKNQIQDLQAELAKKRRSGTTKGRKGMKELENLVLHMQREFKQVKQALSKEGADNLVRKRNAANPNLPPWHVEYGDYNNDSIPDVIVHNAAHQPIIVNGWTTTQSEYPTKFEYYSMYPTKEARKAVRAEMAEAQGKPIDKINAYKVFKRAFAAHEDNAGKLADIKTAHYKVPKNKPPSSYQQFNSKIFTPIANSVFEQLQIPKNVSAMAKACGKIWKEHVLDVVARKGGYQGYDDPRFIAKKKDPGCKQAIDNRCAGIYNLVIENNDEQFNNLIHSTIVDALEGRI